MTDFEMEPPRPPEEEPGTDGDPEFEDYAEPQPLRDDPPGTSLGLGLDVAGTAAAGETGAGGAGGGDPASGEGPAAGGAPDQDLPPLPTRPGDQMDLGQDFVQEPIAPRVYYSIGEVCDLTGLKPHVLRYWESQFEVMNPTKNRAGNRVYRRKDIDLIFLVKRLLYEEKYTIDGARQRVLEMRRDGALDDEKQEVLGPEFLAEMHRELNGLIELLTLPGEDG
jgi:DNA-binding transcriptional MerR regulator